MLECLNRRERLSRACTKRRTTSRSTAWINSSPQRNLDEGKELATKRHKKHKRYLLCFLCLLWLISFETLTANVDLPDGRLIDHEKVRIFARFKISDLVREAKSLRATESGEIERLEPRDVR